MQGLKKKRAFSQGATGDVPHQKGRISHEQAV